MTDTTQPEALRLAAELDAYHTRACHKQAAAELRRLHSLTQGTQPTDDDIVALASDYWIQLDEMEMATEIELVRSALAKWGAPATGGEPVYAFRRKGLDDFCTCDKERYEELSDKPNLFETCILYTSPQPVREPLDGWIDPNDKAQAQYLPHIGEPVLFCHGGQTYWGKHSGGSFVTGVGFAMQHFATWECHWQYPPAAHGITKGEPHGAE